MGFTSWKGLAAFPLSLVVFVLGLIAPRIIVVIFDLESSAGTNVSAWLSAPPGQAHRFYTEMGATGHAERVPREQGP